MTAKQVSNFVVADLGWPIFALRSSDFVTIWTTRCPVTKYEFHMKKSFFNSYSQLVERSSHIATYFTFKFHDGMSHEVSRNQYLVDVGMAQW